MKLKYHERYLAYLSTTDEPKNYEYMAFINKMKKLYGDKYLKKDSTGHYHIDNHDHFTAFIKEQCTIK